MLDHLLQPSGNTSVSSVKETIANLIGLPTSTIVALESGNAVDNNSVIVDLNENTIWEGVNVSGNIQSVTYNPDGTSNLVTTTGSYTLFRFSDRNKTSLVNTLADLGKCKAYNGLVVKTRGAFAVGDGGAGEWIFDASDNSANVSKYPRLFIPAGIDTTGASGAFKLIYAVEIEAVKYGVGLTADKQINKEILEQLVAWNMGRVRIRLPAKTIYVSSLTFNYNPNMEGVFGATASSAGGAGTVIMLSSADSTAPGLFINSATPGGRITGLYLKNISFVGKDFFDAGNISTFAPRTQRTAVSLKFIGGQVDIQNIFIIGFQQALILDEVWDGQLNGVRTLYSGAPDGSSPAVWIGSTATDNSNNLKIYGLHMEFCPYGLYVGICRNVHFYGMKHESARANDATHWGVQFSIGALEVNVTNSMFVTVAGTKQPLVLNQGIRCCLIGCQFVATAPDANSLYPGVVWYLGNRSSENTSNVLADCVFQYPLVSDGTSTYPIQLGNYEQVTDIRIVVPQTVTYSGGTVSPSVTGLITCNVGTIIRGLSVNANSTVKTAGALVNFLQYNSSVTDITLTAGKPIFALFEGSTNNRGRAPSNSLSVTDQTTIDCRGYALVQVTATSNLSVVSFNAFVGDTFSVLLNSGTVTLVNSANLLLLGGANLTMTAGKLYTFKCVSSSGKMIQVS
ncbi:hypothetical protein [Klebsiella pneumoniae]|uniref:hypothetical protein n=1 Tax=Klebsiella pneumoniae TaxID=573 RepID=UPI000D1BC509|nr:hypothetical protein [Klebsiella pneumoniae]